MEPHDADTQWVPGPSTVLSGRYELIEEVGRGGMGVVYRARDRALDTGIAVKVLHPLLGEDPDGVQRLKDEARVAQRLSHPNIVDLRNFEEDGPTRFLIMEYVEGRSLSQILKERGRLPLDEVMKLAEGMCAGLDHAHSQRVIHRDVKPGNFMVAREGTVKITDFGLARVAREIMEQVTQDKVAGTPVFMSPEQLKGEKLDGRTDIYSLGATFYALLSGSPPFVGGDASHGILNEPVPTIPGVPDYVNRALQKALAKEPADRWQTAAELSQALTSPAAVLLRRNLPVQLTSFFGREEELTRLEEMLLTEQRRLVTLTGPGGSGKTRLALEAAGRLFEAFAGAVWFVPLQDLSDPHLIVDAVFDALRLARLPRVEPLERVVEVLFRQPSLLVLDNYEHLVEEGAQVVRQLLEKSPTLTCLVTSRRLLGLTVERQFSVAPLPTPSGDEGPEELVRWASVELFVDRAQDLRPDFQVTEGNAQAVAQLCAGLEGIPLALELAAARAQVLTPAQMLAQLEHRFDFLVSHKRDVERRHETLRAAMEWSYRLLSPELQQFFAQLSVFRGGWTAQAAEAVCGEPQALEHLEELRECSLILAEEGAEEIRFRMLDTLREYAREQLSPEEDAALRQRHAEYYLALAEEAEPRLGGDEQVQWLDRLETEHDNLRAALAWFKSGEHEAEPHLRLAGTLGDFWATRGYWVEGLAHLRDALSREGAQTRTTVRAKALGRAGRLATELNQLPLAEALHQECLSIYRDLGDRMGVAGALNGLGGVAQILGNRGSAQSYWEKSLAMYRELGEKSGIGWCLHNLGLIALGRGDNAASRELLEESVAIRREVGPKSGLSKTLWLLAMPVERLGDDAAALALTEEAYALAREVQDKWMILVTARDLAQLARKRGDHETADAFEEERRIYTRQLYGDQDGPAP